LLRRVKLLRHPQSRGSSVLEIDVEIARSASALTLIYAVRGDIEAVSLPKEVAPARADGLWQHTCFEAFVRSSPAPAYREFNFSPSRQWAAYRFDDYRQGMTTDVVIADPRIELQSDDGETRLLASLDLSDAAAWDAAKDWRLGLSAVIEDRDGGRSWWALAHPPGNPDFHHGDGFVLTLPPERTLGR